VKKELNPRIVVTFDKAKYAALKSFCDKHGMRIAEVIRRGVQMYMEKAK
jgi:hypothetical protein